MTQNDLKTLVNYNPITGEFTNIIKRKHTEIGKILGTKQAGYLKLQLGKDKKSYRLHRLAFLYMVGYIPESIDHINHDRSDNRWCNLREVTPQENKMNVSMQSNNTSGVSGVTWHKENYKWSARIQIKGKRYSEYYNTFEEAVEARKALKLKHGFHANHS